MEFKFDAHQELQVRAIESVTDLLEGQTRIEVDLEFSLGSSYFAAIPNRLNLDEATLLGNLQAVQANNGIRPDNDLQCIEASLETRPEPRSFVSRTFRWKWRPGQARPMSISEPF